MAKNNINLHILNASGKLTPYTKEIENIFDRTIIKVLKKIPMWTGYTLGFDLVAEYFKKNPDKKPSQLYALKAEKFIK